MKNLTLFCAVAALAADAFAWAPVKCPGSGSTMMTEWGEKVTPENAWRAYPRPQLVRKDWTNLNGLWEYAVTSNAAQTVGSPWDAYEAEPTIARGQILVPFAVESPLSGVGRLLDGNELLWYRRTIDVRKESGKRILLHFGAVDLRCQVFIGHREVTDVPHEECNVPFTLDITDFVQDGANELVVCTWDPTNGDCGNHAKQNLNPSGCMYTRSSGIWQTVWMEAVPETYIAGYRVFADIDKGEVKIEVERVGEGEQRMSLSVFDADGRRIGEMTPLSTSTYSLYLPSTHIWTPADPYLYTFKAKCGQDEVSGYFAMRKLDRRRDANGVWRFFLNGEPCFLMGPLDQGWWPDGFLTPPSDEAIAFELKTLKSLGFNMLRKHIKVEPARYYYLCDKMGLMVLQDMPSGFGDLNRRYTMYRRELKSMIDALRVFPSIVMWVPYNEGWGQPGAFFTHATLDWVKLYDPTRLVNGPSGWKDYEGGVQGWKSGEKRQSKHRPEGVCEAADVIDMHVYRGPGMPDVNERRISFLGEFGGLGHAVEGHTWKASSKGWGYGGTDDTATREGLQKAYLGLMDELATLAGLGLSGSVYTQTTDVEIEINGYLTYDRKVLKYDVPTLRKAHEKVYEAAAFAARHKTERKVLFPKQDPDKSAWAYSFVKPAADWTAYGFDDASWARSAGGFGGSGITKDHPAAKYATEWTGSDVWVRRHFKSVRAGDVLGASLEMFHDEDVVVYLNGVEIFSRKGFNTKYQTFALDADKFVAALRKGDNVFAAHVRQTAGGQFFDCGLNVLRLSVR